jgi:dTDP-4-dehydrorhamnose 3,5-epimerase
VKRSDTALPGVCILEGVVHGDERGFFTELYRADTFRAVGIDCAFVQDNYSRSAKGVLRGLHYQLGRPQAKLVRVLQGEVYDVAVDVRRGSPTFGRWVGEVLSAANRRSLFVPAGFAHGFCVMSASAEFLYKCSDLYAPAEERGIAWDDPQLAIPWPLDGAAPTLSAKDRAYGTLATRPEADLPRFSA